MRLSEIMYVKLENFKALQNLKKIFHLIKRIK